MPSTKSKRCQGVEDEGHKSIPGGRLGWGNEEERKYKHKVYDRVYNLRRSQLLEAWVSFFMYCTVQQHKKKST